MNDYMYMAKVATCLRFDGYYQVETDFTMEQQKNTLKFEEEKKFEE